MESHLFEVRLENTLKDISKRCTNIESQLTDIARLQERVNNHTHVIDRFGNRLDLHEGRLHNAELWQADHGDKSYFKDTIYSVGKRIDNLEKNVDLIESHIDKTTGMSSVVKEILKWTAALFGAIVMAKITGTIQ